MRDGPIVICDDMSLAAYLEELEHFLQEADAGNAEHRGRAKALAEQAYGLLEEWREYDVSLKHPLVFRQLGESACKHLLELWNTLEKEGDEKNMVLIFFREFSLNVFDSLYEYWKGEWLSEGIQKRLNQMLKSYLIRAWQTQTLGNALSAGLIKTMVDNDRESDHVKKILDGALEQFLEDPRAIEYAEGEELRALFKQTRQDILEAKRRASVDEAQWSIFQDCVLSSLLNDVEREDLRDHFGGEIVDWLGENDQPQLLGIIRRLNQLAFPEARVILQTPKKISETHAEGLEASVFQQYDSREEAAQIVDFSAVPEKHEAAFFRSPKASPRASSEKNEEELSAGL